MFLIALFAPVVAYVVYEWSQRREFDEHKLLPLFVASGAYGIIMVGLVSWGTSQGGYFGLDSGPYAFQNAEVNVLWQLVGLVVAVAMGLVAAVLAFVLERTIGLGVSEQVQVEGYDLHYWGAVHDEPTTAPSEPRPDQNGSRKASPVSGYRGQDHVSVLRTSETVDVSPHRGH